MKEENLAETNVISAFSMYPNRVMEHYWLQAHMMVLQEYGQKMVSQMMFIILKHQTAMKCYLANL